MFTDVIIMAGGSGTRLWPASHSKKPKQFLPLPGDSSFFSKALERAFAILEDSAGASDGKLLIIAGASHRENVLSFCLALPQERRSRVVLIGECCARNTAPALACAAIYLERSFGAGRRALVLTSDHIIEPLSSFISDARTADELARQGQLVVFGIPPRGPETGFGYIEAAGERLGAAENAYTVKSFREKPDLETAKGFIASGFFSWNSGMFGFSVESLLADYREHAPEVLAPFEALAAPEKASYRMQDNVACLERWEGLDDAYRAVTSISFDYAIAEKCRRVAVVKASFNWTDIGSWDDYARYLEQSGADRAAAGLFSTQSTGCFVDSDLPVALCGVEDLIVVARSGVNGEPPSLLICRKGTSQGLKAITEQIKNSGRKELL